MPIKSNNPQAYSLISIELEMEKEARLALENKLKEKDNEIAYLKSILKEKQTNHEHSTKRIILDTINNLSIGILFENETGLVMTINNALLHLLKINIPIDYLIGTDLLNNKFFDQTQFLNPIYFHKRTNEILNNREEVRNDIFELKDGTIIERDFIPIFEGDLYKGHLWLYNNTTIINQLRKQIEQQKEIYEKVISHLPIDIAVLKPAYSDFFLNPIAIKDNDLRQWIIEWLIDKNNIGSNNDTIKSYKSLFNEVITRKASGQIEEMKTDENGKVLYLLRSINPILDESENIEMLIGYNTDITERVRIENELKKEKKITEELSEAKDLFLANVSHEIRTPMSGILGVVNLLAKTKLNQKQLKMTSMINEAATNLLTIVNDILHLEKITSGKLELEEIPFSLAEKVLSIAESFQLRVKEKNLYLDVENEMSNNPTIFGDPYRISQIINNLLSNAIKFTEQGGIKIYLSTITESLNEIWLKIEIKDTGIGIAPEMIEPLFEPYKQAESATTRKYGGTGLGLSICKNLVEFLGGRIAVDSVLGKGSTFSCIIPFKKQLSASNTIKKVENYEKLKGCKVLLAEDVEMNQFIARSILEERNIQIDIASNGKEVIEMVQLKTYDIILMDISMPYIDGIQATSIIRSMKDPLINRIPILAITANTLKGDEKKYRDAGMNGYISKPFQEKQLLDAIINSFKKESFIIETNKEENITNNHHKLYNEELIMGMGKNKPAFIEKMIGLFLKTMPTDMELLDNSASKKDWKMVEKTAHRMKSAIRGMGIEKAVKPIKLIEEMAQTKPNDLDLLNQIKILNGILIMVIQQIKTDYPHLKVPN